MTAAAAPYAASAPLPGISSYFEFHLGAQTAQIALRLESVKKLTKKIAELEAPVQLPKAQPATDSFQVPNGDP